LRRITDEQGKALHEELAARGIEAKVYVGMRYWHPYTNDAVEKILADGISDLVILPCIPSTQFQPLDPASGLPVGG
jgi:ferrochelatase